MLSPVKLAGNRIDHVCVISSQTNSGSYGSGLFVISTWISRHLVNLGPCYLQSQVLIQLKINTCRIQVINTFRKLWLKYIKCMHQIMSVTTGYILTYTCNFHYGTINTVNTINNDLFMWISITFALKCFHFIELLRYKVFYSLHWTIEYYYIWKLMLINCYFLLCF